MSGYEEFLLGVDMGIRSGFALYSSQQGLCWFRSHNFGSRRRLRSGIYTILRSIPHLRWVVIEGSRDMARLWRRRAQALGIEIEWVCSEQWRREVLPHPRQRGYALKEEAIEVALNVIRYYHLSLPRSLNHNAAEAILIGLWGAKQRGWRGIEGITRGD